MRIPVECTCGKKFTLNAADPTRVHELQTKKQIRCFDCFKKENSDEQVLVSDEQIGE